MIVRLAKGVARDCNSDSTMRRRLGAGRARRLRVRLAQLEAAGTVADLASLPGRWHPLTGDRAGRWSGGLDGPYRVIIVATTAAGGAGADWAGVEDITVIEITDTHEDRHGVVDMTTTIYAPDYAVPPGEMLGEYLDERDLTQVELAARLDISTKHLSRLVNGRVALTPEMAVRLERVTGIAARIWSAMEVTYRDRVLRLGASPDSREAAWLDLLPGAVLRRLGHLPSHAPGPVRLEAALRFFEVSSLSAWERTWAQPEAAFRAGASEAAVVARATWLRLAQLTTERLPADRFGSFDEARFVATLRMIREALPASGSASEVVSRLAVDCAAAGVAVVFVPLVPRCRVSGAAFSHRGRPTIAVSDRFRTDDHLWFTFFHEAAHVALHGRRRFVDGDGPRPPATAVEEAQADDFARDILVPPDAAGQLPGLHSRTEIVRFAHSAAVPPGVVVGRLQHDGHIPHSAHNDLKRRLPRAEA